VVRRLGHPGTVLIVPFRDGGRQSAPWTAGDGKAAGARLEELLRRHRGSVTDLLEQLAGEPVDADIRAQSHEEAQAGNPLGLAPGTDLMGRAVLLRGRVSSREFVYAEASIATGRLPAPVVHRLEHTRDPIGRVLDGSGLPISRVPLSGRATPSRAEEPIHSALATAVLSRRYCILVGTARAFAVDEWFLDPVAEAADLRSPR
jgi:chorismate-pyruvate lyase